MRRKGSDRDIERRKRGREREKKNGVAGRSTLMIFGVVFVLVIARRCSGDGDGGGRISPSNRRIKCDWDGKRKRRTEI